MAVFVSKSLYCVERLKSVPYLKLPWLPEADLNHNLTNNQLDQKDLEGMSEYILAPRSWLQATKPIPSLGSCTECSLMRREGKDGIAAGHSFWGSAEEEKCEKAMAQIFLEKRRWGPEGEKEKKRISRNMDPRLGISGLGKPRRGPRRCATGGPFFWNGRYIHSRPPSGEVKKSIRTESTRAEDDGFRKEELRLCSLLGISGIRLEGSPHLPPVAAGRSRTAAETLSCGGMERGCVDGSDSRWLMLLPGGQTHTRNARHTRTHTLRMRLAICVGNVGARHEGVLSRRGPIDDERARSVIGGHIMVATVAVVVYFADRGQKNNKYRRHQITIPRNAVQMFIKGRCPFRPSQLENGQQSLSNDAYQRIATAENVTVIRSQAEFGHGPSVGKRGGVWDGHVFVDASPFSPTSYSLAMARRPVFATAGTATTGERERERERERAAVPRFGLQSASGVSILAYATPSPAMTMPARGGGAALIVSVPMAGFGGEFLNECVCVRTGLFLIIHYPPRYAVYRGHCGEKAKIWMSADTSSDEENSNQGDEMTTTGKVMANSKQSLGRAHSVISIGPTNIEATDWDARLQWLLLLHFSLTL
ncbi:hypothetical protein CCUS01_15853 [Colletotrichum cuscutae]|uniref:Uncharacterized protein n=1 Tax=Colletotrichum cuscutae TaxID=1209917 RepID=A0AAI9VFT8_9PEZI|nr:hypothetical protein CCUS01_15853 [Colletotrichum cuscutae]